MADNLTNLRMYAEKVLKRRNRLFTLKQSLANGLKRSYSKRLFKKLEFFTDHDNRDLMKGYIGVVYNAKKQSGAILSAAKNKLPPSVFNDIRDVLQDEGKIYRELLEIWGLVIKESTVLKNNNIKEFFKLWEIELKHINNIKTLSKRHGDLQTKLLNILSNKHKKAEITDITSHIDSSHFKAEVFLKLIAAMFVLIFVIGCEKQDMTGALTDNRNATQAQRQYEWSQNKFYDLKNMKVKTEPNDFAKDVKKYQEVLDSLGKATENAKKVDDNEAEKKIITLSQEVQVDLDHKTIIHNKMFIQHKIKYIEDNIIDYNSLSKVQSGEPKDRVKGDKKFEEIVRTEKDILRLIKEIEDIINRHTTLKYIPLFGGPQDDFGKYKSDIEKYKSRLEKLRKDLKRINI